MADAAPVLITHSTSLVDGGRGVRFMAELDGTARPAFAIRYQGRVHAYVNACRHQPIELDLTDGDFYDASGHYLVCSMHGALYRPDDGLCVHGPCRGARLRKLTVVEHDGGVYYQP